jgi:hypothetical protein
MQINKDTIFVATTFLQNYMEEKRGSPAISGWCDRWQQHARAWPAAEGQDVATDSSSWMWPQ